MKVSQLQSEINGIDQKIPHDEKELASKTKEFEECVDALEKLWLELKASQEAMTLFKYSP